MARALSALILAAAAAPDGALAASLCMDLPDLSTIQHGSGGPVQVWDCLNSDIPALSEFARVNQQWLVQAYTGGPQQIYSQALEWLCLDLAGGDTTNGNAVEVWECNGLANQQWVFGDDYHIRFFADQSKCVDAGDMQDGTPLMIWDCNGLSQQNWGYDSEGSRKTIYLSDSRRLQVPAPGSLRGARKEQRGSEHNLTSSPCPVDPSHRSCNPGDAGKSFSFDAVCDCQFYSFCRAECPEPHPADCWICTGGGCSGGGLGNDFESAVAKAYPGCQPCNVPNGGGFDWKLYAIEDHRC